MNEQEKALQMINQFIMLQYVKQISQGKPKVVTLQAPAYDTQVSLILIDEPSVWVPAKLGKHLN